MIKNTYSYEVFFEIKDTIDKMNTPTKNITDSLENILNIIENNYGVKYHEKNNKHKKRNNISSNTNYNVMDQAKWRLKKTTINKNIKCDLDKYKYEINSLLNKMSSKNFEVISNKIMEYYSKSLLEEELNNLIINFIDSIFSKAVMQPIYCPYYVKFLNILEDKFKILYLVDEKCNNFRDIFIKSVEETKLETEQEAYDKFCKDNLEKVFKAGYSQFIGELFNNNMIKVDIINSNIDFFMKSLESNLENQDMFENIIICISQLIMTTKNKLIELKYDFNILYGSFISIYNTYNNNKRLKYKLMDLCEYVEKIK